MVEGEISCSEIERLTNTLFAFSQVIPHWLEAIKLELETYNSLQELMKGKIQKDEAIRPRKLLEGIILFKDQVLMFEQFEACP